MRPLGRGRGTHRLGGRYTPYVITLAAERSGTGSRLRAVQRAALPPGYRHTALICGAANVARYKAMANRRAAAGCGSAARCTGTAAALLCSVKGSVCAIRELGCRPCDRHDTTRQNRVRVTEENEHELLDRVTWTGSSSLVYKVAVSSVAP